jgi:hypothetical protein
MHKTESHKVQECILNIDLICRNIYQSYEEVMGLNLTSESTIYRDTIRYRYIQLCSILDEIEILHGLAKDDNYLKDTLYIISPIIKALNQYSGLKRARNYMFAHYNRDKKKQFYPWWLALKDLKLPVASTEITDIYKHLQIMNTLIITRYHAELDEIINRTRPDFNSYMEQSRKATENNDTQSIFNNVMEEVEKKMIEKGADNQLIFAPVVSDINYRLNQRKLNIEKNLAKKKDI